MISDPMPHAWTFEAIGTVWRIDTAEPLAASVRDAVGERVERFDRDWSRFRADSRLAPLARGGATVRLADDAGPLLALYRDLYAATDGRVSPLVGRSLETLGYDAAYRLAPLGDPEPAPSWDGGWEGGEVSTVAPLVVDVGAAGKGYLVDLVGDVLAEHGVAEHVVDGSGDLRTRGVAMRIALENPADPRKAVGVAELSDGALCASATTRRTWGDGLHHVLDALTGRPVDHWIATWAIAPTALVADGAATALFFEPNREFLSRQGVEFARMSRDGHVECSDRFPGEVFT